MTFAEKGADYPVKVSGVDMSPNPIARGKPATFNISATTGTRTQLQLPLFFYFSSVSVAFISFVNDYKVGYK